MQLPAYKITLSDGSNYITSMAAHVTIDIARTYFMGQVQVSEDFETGKETRRVVVNVEAVN